MSLREGMVVVITGPMDDRVRPIGPETPKGTVVDVASKSEVVVLMSNGNIWRGAKHQVYEDQSDAGV